MPYRCLSTNGGYPLGLCFLTLLLAGLPAAKAAEVSAAERDAFERWVDEQVALALQGGESAEDAIEQLRVAQVDWESFRVRGRSNHDFPKMMFLAEWWEKPLYHLDPRHLKLPGKRRADPKKVRMVLLPQVRHSSFFTVTNIESYTPDRITEEFLEIHPAPPLEITKVKSSGTSEGLWAKDALGRTFILIFDPPFAPEMTTSAEYIGSTIVRIAGYQVPKICICTVEGTGNPSYDGRRAVATLALDGFEGGWRYADFRDRGEIRALRLFAAWIDNVDQTEQNTGVTKTETGVHRHYVLDFGASLGSFTYRPKLARLGWTKLFDPVEQFTQPLYDHGIRKVAWEAPYEAHSPAIGYFSANYDPDTWQPFYTNMGFVDVSEGDKKWAATRIGRFRRSQLRRIVELAAYSHPEDAEHVLRTLIERRNILVERYLGIHHEIAE